MAGMEWKQMTEAEKQPFYDQHYSNMVTYLTNRHGENSTEL